MKDISRIFEAYRFNEKGDIEKFNIEQYPENAEIPKDVVILLFPSNLPTKDEMDDLIDQTIWGTFGIDGKDHLKWVFLNHRSDEHLVNIIKHIDEVHFKLYGYNKRSALIKSICKEILDRRKQGRAEHGVIG